MTTLKIDRNKLRQQLMKTGIKQSYIAYKMDVSERTVSRWVTGKVMFIKSHNLKGLCDILTCDRLDLLQVADDSLADTLIEKNLLEKLSPYGDFDLVEKIFLKTLTEEMSDHRRAEIYLILANTSWRSHKYQLANDYIKRAKELSNKNDILFEAYFHQATILSIQGDFKALSMFEKAYQLKEHVKSSDRLAALCNNLSMMYREMGYLEKAITYMDEAVLYFEMDDKYFNLCISMQGYMTIYNEMHQAKKSIECGKLGKEYAKKSNYDKGLKSILLYELDTYKQLDKPISAEHRIVLNEVINKEYVDYYALEAVFRFLIKSKSDKVEVLLDAYIEEVPLFVKAVLYEITGNIDQAKAIYKTLSFDKRIKLIEELDL